MSKKYPKFGRVFSAHFSAAMSIPYAVIVLKCLPVDTPNQDKHFGLYTAVFFLFSLVISWCGPRLSSTLHVCVRKYVCACL